MKESKFFKNTASEHHEQQHGTDVLDMPSKDDHAHESTPHEDKKRSHRKEQNFPKERGETKMKIKTAPALIALLAVLFVFGFAADIKAKTTEFKFDDVKATSFEADKFEASKFQPSAFQTSKFEAFNSSAFTTKDFSFKADYFGKATFKNFGLKDFGFKMLDSKVFKLNANEFEKARFTFADFEKVNFRT